MTTTASISPATTKPFRAFSVNNLADPVITREFDRPWENAPAVPEGFKTDREAYKRWLATPGTVVPLFSLVEGENSAVQVSATNPPHLVHGIVADYDCEISDAECAEGLKRVPPRFPVFAWNRTRRGGVRLVWRFETPSFCYGPDTYKRLLLRARKELRLSGIFPNLDEDTLVKPNQYYTAGNNWTVSPEACIKPQTVWTWLHEVLGQSKDFDKADVEIPFDKLEAAVHERFPGRWQGAFTEGARGIRFWDPVADNPTAAIVRKTGVTCFTGPKPFMRWTDIFGRDFIAAYQENLVGKAVQNIYSEKGNSYYRRNEAGVWINCDLGALRRHFNVSQECALSAKPEDGGRPSQVERAVYCIENDASHHVECGVEIPHNRDTVVRAAGHSFLNTSNARLAQPAEDPVAWGEGFPWIAKYLKTLMKDEDNLNVLLYSTAYWYQSCYRGRPVRGHAMFLAGEPGVGKSFYSNCILSRIFGGATSVRNQFTDPKTNRFNHQDFGSALWTIDDAIPRDEKDAHTNYSNAVKSLVADPLFRYARKFGKETSVPFCGRLWVTLNMDSKSITMLPNVELSTKDKFCFLATGKTPPDMADDEGERYEIIERELPFFCRWLLDMQRPAMLDFDTRFGFKAWYDPALLSSAQNQSDSTPVADAVNLWRHDHEVNGKRPTEWTGTTAELLVALRSHGTASLHVERHSVVTLGRQLANLVRADHPWIKQGTRTARYGNRYVVLMPTEDSSKAE